MKMLPYRIFIRLVLGTVQAIKEMAGYNVDKIEQTKEFGSDWLSDFKVLPGDFENPETGEVDLYFYGRDQNGNRAVCSFSEHTKKETNAYEQNIRFLSNRFGCLPIAGDEFDPDAELLEPTVENLKAFNAWADAMNRLYGKIRVELHDDGQSDNLSIRFPEKAEQELMDKENAIDSESIAEDNDDLFAELAPMPEPEPQSV